MPYQIAALLAALAWALSSLIAADPVRELGGPRSTRLRMIAVTLILAVAATLFTAMARIGPRRTGLVFTVNAPFAAVMGLLVFDETFTVVALLGAALTVSGVAVAVGYRRTVSTVRNVAIGDHSFERVEGRLWIFARPLDRVAGAKRREPLTWRHVGYLIVSATLAMAIGMSLVLHSLGHGDVGVATILSATTPVMLLPLLWITTRRRPTGAAWAGAALTVIGAALLII